MFPSTRFLGLPFFLFLLLVLLPGCDHHLYSPPARAMPLESADTLPAGHTGVALEGGDHGAPFGPELLSGTARVRHGLDDETEVSIEGTVLHVEGQPAADVSPNALSARVGVKRRLFGAEQGQSGLLLSVTGGLGGGGSAAGGFMSPDVGGILSIENRYVVPFVSLRAGFSEPFAARVVNTTAVGDTTATSGAPKFTGVFGGVLGLRVPIGWDPKSDVHGALLGGLGLTELADASDSAPFVSLSVGAECTF